MKISTQIKKRIEKQGPDSIWSFKDFSGLSSQAVAQTLSRLARSGFLNRVRKCVYYYPKTTALGKSAPSVGDIVSKIANRKGTRNFLGYTAASYNLGLTTQVPNSLVIVGYHQNKTITIGGQVVQFRHRKVDHLKNADDQVVWALDALRNIQKIPGSTAGDALVKIIQLTKSGRLDISKLLHFAQQEPPRVRALLGAIADHLNYRGLALSKIKNSLNPVTSYKLGLGNTLPTASNWNIV